jgi:DNA-binding protein HU-beta
MNKSQLVDALADRLGDRRAAANAVDSLLKIVVETVQSGEPVSLAGFGVFETRARAARTGRNPRTGESVDVAATTVPAFRPGTGFRNAVAGDTTGAAPAAPRRRATRAATNGAGGGSASAALDGAVDLATSPATALDGKPAKSGKKTPAKNTKAPAKNAKDTKGKAGKAAKDTKDAKDTTKKGKKGKK